jgi:hypothetical protein
MPGATHELGELRQPARRRGVVRHSAQGRANQPAGQGRKVRFFFFANSSLDCATGCLFELYCHSKIEILFQ